LQKLVRIYEITHDWEEAIPVYRELSESVSDFEIGSQVAHYYCELAEHAVQDSDFTRARELLELANNEQHQTLRSKLALGDLARQTDEHQAAIQVYKEVMDAEPRLIGEIIPALAESCRALEDQELLSATLNGLRQHDPLAGKVIAMAAIQDPKIQNATALECLWDYISEDPILAQLVDTAALVAMDDDARQEAIGRVRSGLARLISATHRYRCSECGYVTSLLLWQCPSCHSWETVVPVGRLSLTSPIS
jgi:lipopolysaccharide biosynthesis regulator YciM